MPYIRQHPNLDRLIPREIQHSMFSGENSGNTTGTSNRTYFYLFNNTPRRILSGETISLWMKVNTAASTITWAEVGLFVDLPSWDGTPTLTRVAWTDVSTKFNSVGLKKVDLVFNQTLEAGEYLWFAWGSQATTPYTLQRGGVDTTRLGNVWYSDTARVSNVSGSGYTPVTVSYNSLSFAQIFAEW